jgi:predicted nucleic acid-binding protein
LLKLAKTEKQGNQIWIPSIVYYEVGRGLAAAKATAKQAAFERLCSRLGIADLDHAAFDIAIRIYTDHKSAGALLDDVDILIAATCIRHGFTLITNNEKHFSRISELSCDNLVT